MMKDSTPIAYMVVRHSLVRCQVCKQCIRQRLRVCRYIRSTSSMFGPIAILAFASFTNVVSGSAENFNRIIKRTDDYLVVTTNNLAEKAADAYYKTHIAAKSVDLEDWQECFEAFKKYFPTEYEDKDKDKDFAKNKISEMWELNNVHWPTFYPTDTGIQHRTLGKAVTNSNRSGRVYRKYVYAQVPGCGCKEKGCWKRNHCKPSQKTDCATP